jgi:hypothetical protein
VQLQVVFLQWCIWGCRSLGWHCHWASSSQHLKEHSTFIMLDPWKWRYYIPSEHQRLHPSNTLFYRTRPGTWKVQLYAITKLILQGKHTSEGVQGKQTKNQTGKTFIKRKLHLSFFLIPFLMCVPFKLVSMRHVTVHTYFICSSNTW